MMATLSLGAEGEGGPGSSGKRDLRGTSLRPTLRTRFESLLTGPPAAEAMAAKSGDFGDWEEKVRKWSCGGMIGVIRCVTWVG
jgi:hypothetical protein